jgi:hypothetical protein
VEPAFDFDDSACDTCDPRDDEELRALLLVREDDDGSA